MQQQDIIQKIQHLIAEGETEGAINELNSQEDSNLCVRSSTNDEFRWGSFQESEIFATKVRFLEDGNLAIYDAKDRNWSTGTSDPNAALGVTNHGVLVVVNAANEVIWEGEKAN